MRLVPAILIASCVAGCGASAEPPAEVASPGRLHVEAAPSTPLPASTFRVGSALETMTNVSFRLADLPTYVAKDQAQVKTAERPLQELAVSRQGTDGIVQMVGGEGRFGRLTFDDQVVSSSSVRVRCVAWAAAHLGVQILEIHADGRASYTRVDGIFDGSACEAVERHRVSIQPAVLIPGYLFAYRTCSSSPCGAGKERVVFLMPPLVGVERDPVVLEAPVFSEPFGVVSVEPLRGAASTLTAIVNEAALHHMFSVPPPWLKRSPVMVGVDLVHSTAEAEPVAIASFGEVVAPPDEPPAFDH